MHICRQSAVQIFVLWQHYCTRDVIGIKMTCRDLPYYEGMRAKTRHENKCKNHVNLLHTLENGP